MLVRLEDSGLEDEVDQFIIYHSKHRLDKVLLVSGHPSSTRHFAQVLVT